MIKHRPFPLTLVCLYLIIAGCWFTVMSFDYLNDPYTQAMMAKVSLPIPVQVTMLYLNLVISVLCGIFMLQEFNWSRWVYLGWGFINMDYNFFTQSEWQESIVGVSTTTATPWHFATPMLVYLLFALILLIPTTNEYFASSFDYDNG